MLAQCFLLSCVAVVSPEWPSYFEPTILNSITGVLDNGVDLSIDRAFLIHRDDAERFIEKKELLTQCVDALNNGREIGFFESDAGKVLILSVGIIVGTALGITVSWARF